MIYIFIDTNFFMQHVQYDHLPWHDLFDKDIHIIIPRKVVSEIDKHKNSANRRLSKRANGFTPLLKELRNGSKTIQHGALNLTISIGERINAHDLKRDFLDPSDPDDCIVNEVLHWVECNSDKQYYVLAGDIHMTLTCTDCEVPYIDIPESWRLPEEKDEKDKEIDRLKKQVARTPLISINSKESFINADVPEYKELSQQQIRELSTQLFVALPEKTEFDTHPSQKRHTVGISVVADDDWNTDWIYPSKDEIEKYKKEYESWQSSVINAFADMHSTLKNFPSRFLFLLEIENLGRASAENIELRIETTGGVELIPPGEEKDWLWGYRNSIIPLPPKAPQKRKSGEVLHDSPTSLKGFYDLAGAKLPREKKVNEFYWKKYPETPATTWELSCTEFRHQMGAYSIELTLLIPEQGYTRDVALHVTVSAKNISEPKYQKIPIRPNKTEGDLFSRLQQAVSGFIEKYQKPVSTARLFEDEKECKPELF